MGTWSRRLSAHAVANALCGGLLGGKAVAWHECGRPCRSPGTGVDVLADYLARLWTFLQTTLHPARMPAHRGLLCCTTARDIRLGSAAVWNVMSHDSCVGSHN
eukprot:359978-Chlamydomonas_euryale.AAC.1